MDRTERFFQQHGEDFDQLDVSPKLWEHIDQQLDQPAKRRGLVPAWLWSAAAVFVAALLLVGLLYEHPPALGEDTILPDIALESPNGEHTPLSSLEARVVLVNFWASWDAVCEENNCYVFLPIYEKYRERGFEIYGVSIDSDREAWVASIHRDALPWVNVSDLQGWNSPLRQQFDVDRLPTSFLIDENRRIIARDLNAEELDNTLSALLAYNEK